MFKIAVLIGIYSYSIFLLGIFGLLYKEIIFFLTGAYFLAIGLFFIRFKPKIKVQPPKFTIFLLSLFVFQIIVNLVGALGPELAFDALWYHLTLPKLYLQSHALKFFPGGLLYYSGMPQFTEMLYIGALAIHNEILAKLLQLFFGILTSIVIYKISRKFFSQTISFLAVVIFYSNLVVAWESITAYVDLARTFFEALALERFLIFLEKKEKKFLLQSSVILGFAISTKLLAFGSLLIFTLLLIIFNKTKSLKLLIEDILVYWYISIIIVIPWLVFAFINTHSPFYPFFSNVYKVGFDFNLLNPFIFIRDIWEIFTHSHDPISPIYIMVFPLLILFFKNINKKYYPIFIYSMLALSVWYLTSRTGGGRFILPYLPAFSVLTLAVLETLNKNFKSLKTMLILIIVLIAFISILYRGAANVKYLPVVLGKETKGKFLTKNLNYSFGDFYDTDNYFKNNISKDKKVLLYGFHNLFYVDFPFIDSSYVKKEDKFDYIAVQNSLIPEKFGSWNLIYYNPGTGVKLYLDKK